MPVTALTSNNISLNSYFNYYDAPPANKSQRNVIGDGNITYPSIGTTNINIGYYRGTTYFFYLKCVNTNGTKGTVFANYPWSQSSTALGYVGGSKQLFYPIYSYINFTCSANYGYTFKGWYNAPVGGVLLSSVANNTIYYNDVNRGYVWYAQYN